MFLHRPGTSGRNKFVHSLKKIEQLFEETAATGHNMAALFNAISGSSEMNTYAPSLASLV